MRSSRPSTSPSSSRAGRPVREAAGIVVLGAVLGLTANAISPRGIPLAGDFSRGAALANLNEKERAALPAEIGVAGVDSALAAADGLLLDARTAEDYEAGHIPGALNLPVEQFDAAYPALKDTLATASRLITYCDGGDCELSKQLGEVLKGQGFARVQLFAGGINAWLEAEKPLREGKEP